MDLFSHQHWNTENMELDNYGKFVWNFSKLNSRHINFYFKKLTQVEAGYGPLNVA